MKFSLVAKLVSVLTVCLLMSNSSFGQKKDNSAPKKPLQKSMTEEQLSKKYRETVKVAPRTGPSFTLSPIGELPGRFSLLMSDTGGRTIAETFIANQLEILEAIMLEAKKFAQTDEAVGLGKPIITRFYDKNDQSFMVDVMKEGNQTRFFVTIKSLTNNLTVDAGTIIRTDTRPRGFFYDILSRVQEIKAVQNPNLN